MNVGNFVSNHKLLCGLTLGLAIVGYMGCKVVKWIVSKLGLVQKTDNVANQTLSKINNPIKGLQKPPVIEEHLRIVQDPKSVQDYLNEEYKGFTPQAIKYRKRLELIGKYYEKNTIYPVRGDGNCFCNAAVAGLLSIPNNRVNIIHVFEKKKNTNQNYIKPDPNSTTEHLTHFNKDKDFKIVLAGLADTNLTTEALFKDFEFTAAFARVIRYLLSTQSEGCATNGQEMDIDDVWSLNTIFNTRVEAIVLAAPLKDFDPELPDSAYTTGSACINIRYLDLKSAVNPPFNKPEFLIIRKGAHFIALT